MHLKKKKLEIIFPLKASPTASTPRHLSAAALQSSTAAEPIIYHKQMLEIFVLLNKLCFLGLNATM